LIELCKRKIGGNKVNKQKKGKGGFSMKKVLFISVLVLLLTTSVVSAGQFPGLLGGAFGYLSSYSGVASYFNANAGQQLAISGFSTVNTAYCGLSTISNPTKFLILGFIPTQVLFITAPYTDLYLLTCVKYSGTSDYITIGAVDYSIYSAVYSIYFDAGMSNMQINNENEITQELLDRLTEEVNKMVIK
jgi:hypothetical protein